MLITKFSLFLNFGFCVLFAECNNDYFEEDFDENKNCKDEETIEELEKQKDPVRCITVRKGNDKAVQYEECKRLLTRKLVESCLGVDVAKVCPKYLRLFQNIGQHYY